MLETGIIALSISGGLDEVRLLGVSVRAIARALVSAEQASLVELCTVEVANNCIEHAYRGTGGGTIHVQLAYDDDTLSVEVRDHGRPIRPERFSDPSSPFDFDPDATEHLPEGGMGLALVRANVSGFEYRRDGEANVTRMLFERAPAARPRGVA